MVAATALFTSSSPRSAAKTSSGQQRATANAVAPAIGRNPRKLITFIGWCSSRAVGRRRAALAALAVLRTMMACCDFEIAVQLGHIRRGLAELVLERHVGAGIDQHADHRRIVMGGGDHQRRDAVGRLRIDVGAAVEQALGDIGRTRAAGHEHGAFGRRGLARRDHQRRQRVGAGQAVHVGARLHQGLGRLIFVLGDGQAAAA